MNRIIPTLILKDGYIVKGKKFKNHEYVGEPINIVKIFNDKKVDEILILDISKKKDFKLIEDISSESTVPINYAGKVDNLKKLSFIFFSKKYFTNIKIYKNFWITEYFNNF